MPLAEEISQTEVAQLWLDRFRMTRRAVTACFFLAASVLALSGVVVYTIHVFRSWRPLVYRVDEHHRAVAEVYSQVAENWNEDDAKIDIEDFLRYYLTRDRQSINVQDFGFPRSLWYLSKPLSDAAKQSISIVNPAGCADGNFETCTVATFLGDGLAPQIAVRMEATSIRGFKPQGQGKFQAVTTFWQDLIPISGEKHSALYTASVIAEFIYPVPAEYLPSDRNPRGLIVSDIKIRKGYAE
jgi:hypothetical protein